MCFRRHTTSNPQDEDVLPPRPVLASRSDYKECHSARTFESHLEHQRDISAVLQALDIQDQDYQTLPDAIDFTIDTANGSPIVVLQPQPHRHESLSRSSKIVLASPSILLNCSIPKSISLLGSSKQRDACAFSKLKVTSRPSLKPSLQPTNYNILPSRPRSSDPPDLCYENYEIWDKVQKENYEVGGGDLDWKTGVVDLKIEAELLQDYVNWVRDCRSDLRTEGSLIKQRQIYGAKPGSERYKRYKMVNRKDREFMAGLKYELKREIREVAKETHQHDEKYGKELEDSIVVWDIVERLEREEGEKKKRERERERERERARSEKCNGMTQHLYTVI